MIMGLTEKQIIARQEGIGGSDAPVIMGLGRFKTPLELYLEKRGDLEPPDLSDNEAVYWGNKLEDIAAEVYMEKTGCKVQRSNLTAYHPKHKWMLCHVDRKVVGESKALEIKTAVRSIGWGDPGTDQVPDDVMIQCQHNLEVIDREIMDVPVLIAGRDFRIYEVRRDQELIDMIIEREAAFVECVESGVPPELTFDHKTTIDLLKHLYPGTNGQKVKLPQTAQAWHEALMDAKKLRLQYDKAVEIAKAHLLSLMGDASVGELPDGNSYTRKLVTRKSYEVKEASYVDFRHIKIKI
jgi:putative phage-type endonuclease